MTWAKVDDRFPRHPKAIEVGPLGRDLFVCGLCSCNEHLTDGFIPVGALPTLAPADPAAKARNGVTAAAPVARRLVAAGLWEEAPGGWRVHDYHDWNPTAEQIKARRNAILRRVSRWRQGRSNGVTNASRNGVSNAAPTPTPTPTPTEKKTRRTSPVGSVPAGLSWDEYITSFDAAGQDLLRQTAEAVASTRKGGKVASSVLDGLAHELSRFETMVVLRACRTYLARGYAGEGKAERYLLGIVRSEAERAARNGHGVDPMATTKKTHGQQLIDRVLAETLTEHGA